MSEPIINKTVIGRRHFLKQSGSLGGGLFISFTLFGAGGKRGKAITEATPDGFSPNAFLHIKLDNSITITLTHVEMGQGIWTTLPMLMADELDCNWKNITIVHAPANPAYNHAAFGIQLTGGSSTTWSEFDRYRQAGATARILLTEVAAKRMNVSAADCRTENGYVINGKKKFSYGELANEASLLPVPKEISLRSASQWKYIGKGLKRLDAAVKTNGAAIFGMDIQYPGLKTAVVAHSPVFGGTVKSFDAAQAMKISGVRKVVQIPTGVAVIADHFWAAKRGRDALVISWDEGEGSQLNTKEQVANYQNLVAANGLPAAQKGDVTSGFAQSATIIEANHVFPYLAHAPMEPLNCTVRISDDHCEIWTGTQMPDVEQATAAKILNLTKEQVMINTPFLGGSFGRRAVPQADFISEAVHIAKTSGEFIKMVWTREDDMKSGFYRPMYVHKLKVGLDQQGFPVAWQHNIAGQSIMADKFTASIRNGIDDSSVEGVSTSPYLTSVLHHYVGLHTTTEVVPVLWFRSVGNTHTAYAMETMIDELAHLARQDPIDYRRALLKEHPRHLAALNLVAEKANWNQLLTKNHYHGVAVHEAFGSFVAEVAEISIENEQLKIHKVTCAINCGLAVNPDGVKAQMESGIIFGLTMAMYGELSIENGRLQQSNFYDYKMLRMHEAPAIDVYIVDSNEKMGGAGECGVPPAAPALANAIFAATGKRIYNLPIMNTKLTTA